MNDFQFLFYVDDVNRTKIAMKWKRMSRKQNLRRKS